ncbi:hypothetical protein [Pragia fontium]|nr:hypothetical protein [Pragia fontium]VEJ56979.1 Uncharacterised protein [Pragia fontium]
MLSNCDETQDIVAYLLFDRDRQIGLVDLDSRPFSDRRMLKAEITKADYL